MSDKARKVSECRLKCWKKPHSGLGGGGLKASDKATKRGGAHLDDVSCSTISAFDRPTICNSREKNPCCVALVFVVVVVLLGNVPFSALIIRGQVLENHLQRVSNPAVKSWLGAMGTIFFGAMVNGNGGDLK